MANGRLYLEHVDTGERVMLAKRWSDVWVPNPSAPHSEVWGTSPWAEPTETRIATTSRVWRLLYEDDEAETMPVPENRADRG